MGCTHDCSTCGHDCGSEQDFSKKLNEMSSVKKVIGVVSGKGGVGKSLVTSLLAVSMQRLPHRHPGCRYHRPQHPAGIRPSGKDRNPR